MIRSAIHKIRPTKNFMSHRYSRSQHWNARHIDLKDELSFYGAFRYIGSLHMCTRAFGITSPKEGGVSGEDVARLWKEGAYKDIARYNVEDLVATRELYLFWEKYLNIS